MIFDAWFEGRIPWRTKDATHKQHIDVRILGDIIINAYGQPPIIAITIGTDQAHANKGELSQCFKFSVVELLVEYYSEERADKTTPLNELVELIAAGIQERETP